MLIVIVIWRTDANVEGAECDVRGESVQRILLLSFFLSFSFHIISVFLFFYFSLSFILCFFFLKSRLSKSNTVSRSVRQLQSPALWSGPSILSPTSWLFKRAKAQQCSFLNTQIHPSTNRGTAVWQKSLSSSLSRSSTLSPHLGLWHSPSSPLLFAHPPP